MEEVLLNVYHEPDLYDRTDWERLIAFASDPSVLSPQDAGPPARGDGCHHRRLRTGLDICRLALCLEDWDCPSDWVTRLFYDPGMGTRGSLARPFFSPFPPSSNDDVVGPH